MRTEEEEGELVEPLAGAEKVPPTKKMDSKWANQRLEELLGYGKYQYFQVWVFLGLLSFIGLLFFHWFFLCFSFILSGHGFILSFLLKFFNFNDFFLGLVEFFQDNWP